MKTILVGNPARQHSDQLALALQEIGKLGLYLHGGPARSEVSKLLVSNLHHEAGQFRGGAVMTAAGTCSSIVAAGVPGRGEYLKVKHWA